MNMELEFSNDKVELFLSTKLEEIRLKNESLETVLNQHKDALQSCQNDNVMNEINFQVMENESQKKIFNNKFAVGYVIETANKKDYKDIRVFLTWNSEETFSYKVETFGAISGNKENCKVIKTCNLITDTIEKQSNLFRGRTYLVVVINVPEYLYKLEYEISGNFICNVEGQDFSIPLPKVNVSAKDYSKSTYWISQNSLTNIFSLMACLNQTDLVMILPEEWTASLISTFEIHCAFTYLKMKISCKSYFIANDVSKLFINMLIVVHPTCENSNILFVKVYAASTDQIYALCHHFGSSLPNTTFFPISYYDSYLCKNAIFSKELLEEFGRSMRQELECNYKFAQRFSIGHSSEQFHKFRYTLSTIENNTDKLFLKVSNMKY